MSREEADRRLRLLEEAQARREPAYGAKARLLQLLYGNQASMLAAGVVWSAYDPAEIEAVAAVAVERLEASAASRDAIGMAQMVRYQAHKDAEAGLGQRRPTPARTSGPALADMSVSDLMALLLTRDP